MPSFGVAVLSREVVMTSPPTMNKLRLRALRSYLGFPTSVLNKNNGMILGMC